MATTTLLTIEQFEALPEEVLERHELVQGEMVAVSSSAPEDSLTRQAICFAMRDFLQGRKIGIVLVEVDVKTSSDTIRRPDAAFFSSEQKGRMVRDTVPVQESPLIAIEVLSPSESAGTVHKKVLEYLASGSREVWLIDPLNQIV